VIILSHRGCWTDIGEKNRAGAFSRSFDLGFGTETDIRERAGDLVLSHDTAGKDALRLADMLDLLGRRDLPLALNIKSDGLARALQSQMRARGLSQWFTFDMSVPEAVVQIRLGMPVFTRASEYERQPVLYDQALGVWLDAFVSEWYSAADINGFLQDGKRVAIVSPELHGRGHLALWQRLLASGVKDNPALMLCTDLAEDARAFFGGRA
jgi:glycerophosphoryl diester phosphodiesterase